MQEQQSSVVNFETEVSLRETIADLLLPKLDRLKVSEMAATAATVLLAKLMHTDAPTVIGLGLAANMAMVELSSFQKRRETGEGLTGEEKTQRILQNILVNFLVFFVSEPVVIESVFAAGKAGGQAYAEVYKELRDLAGDLYASIRSNVNVAEDKATSAIGHAKEQAKLGWQKGEALARAGAEVGQVGARMGVGEAREQAGAAGELAIGVLEFGWEHKKPLWGAIVAALLGHEVGLDRMMVGRVAAAPELTGRELIALGPEAGVPKVMDRLFAVLEPVLMGEKINITQAVYDLVNEVCMGSESVDIRQTLINNVGLQANDEDVIGVFPKVGSVLIALHSLYNHVTKSGNQARMIEYATGWLNAKNKEKVITTDTARRTFLSNADKYVDDLLVQRGETTHFKQIIADVSQALEPLQANPSQGELGASIGAARIALDKLVTLSLDRDKRTPESVSAQRKKEIEMWANRITETLERGESKKTVVAMIDDFVTDVENIIGSPMTAEELEQFTENVLKLWCSSKGAEFTTSSDSYSIESGDGVEPVDSSQTLEAELIEEVRKKIVLLIPRMREATLNAEKHQLNVDHIFDGWLKAAKERQKASTATPA